MFKRLLVMTGVCVYLICLQGCSNKEDNQDQQSSQSGGDSSIRIIRKKIDRLDPKSFIEVTLELHKEQKKWNKEWQDFIARKRSEYFESFGLTEKQFNEYPLQHQKEIQRFLKENQRYNEMYMQQMYKLNRHSP